LKVSSSAVAKTIKRYDETGSHGDRHRNERHRVNAAAEDEFIRVTSLRNCSLNKCFTEFKSSVKLGGGDVMVWGAFLVTLSYLEF
jgi:hypothetical protein